MSAWFLWGTILKTIIILASVLVCIINQKINPSDYKFLKNNQYIVLLLAFVFFNEDILAGIVSWLKIFCSIFIFRDILNLKSEVKAYLLDKFLCLFGIISIVGVIGWLLFLFGINMPHSFVVDPAYGYVFNNYYIFIQNEFRYCSIFLEPGHYAMLAVLFLYVYRFNLKNIYVLGIFVSLLFSVSLAGYVLLIVALIILFHNAKALMLYGSIVFVGILVYGYFLSDNDDYNAFDDRIVKRAMRINEDGMSEQRTSWDFNKYYNEFLNSSSVWLGDHGAARHKDWDDGNAGYKMFIVTNGVISTIITFIIHWLLLVSGKSRACRNDNIQRVGLFLLDVLIFINAAIPYWFAFFSTYVWGLSHISVKSDC